jgi:hypothetical protein
MFLGHFGLAFASKKAAPAVSLGMLFVAAQLADLLWPVLVLAGVERVEILEGITAVTPLDFVSYPYSHSLVTLIAWGVALGFAYRIVRGGRWRAFGVIAALVVSHWLLDVLVHRPDMPITPGSTKLVGLGLWDSFPATLALELVFFGTGLLVYLRTTRALDRIGSWALWALVAFFLAIYSAAVLGPPPPSVDAVAWSGLAMWLFVAWGYWVDKHRVARAGVPA